MSITNSKLLTQQLTGYEMADHWSSLAGGVAFDYVRQKGSK